MKKVSISIYAILLSVSLAQDNEIIASGVGKSQEEAVTEALRNCVEIALGTYITSVTEVKNFELVKDKITSLSRGFVKNFTVLNKAIIDGSHIVTVEATITKEEIIDFAPSIGIKVEIDGGLFYQQFALKDDERKREIETLNNLKTASIFDIPIFEAEIKLSAPLKINEMRAIDTPITMSSFDYYDFVIPVELVLKPIQKNIATIEKFILSVVEKISIDKEPGGLSIINRQGTTKKQLIISTNWNERFNHGKPKGHFYYNDWGMVAANEYNYKKFRTEIGFPDRWYNIDPQKKLINNYIISSLDKNSYFKDNFSYIYLNNFMVYKLMDDKSVRLLSEILGKVFQKHKLEISYLFSPNLTITDTVEFDFERSLELTKDERYFTMLHPGYMIGDRELAITISSPHEDIRSFRVKTLIDFKSDGACYGGSPSTAFICEDENSERLKYYKDFFGNNFLVDKPSSYGEHNITLIPGKTVFQSILFSGFVGLNENMLKNLKSVEVKVQN